MRKKEKMLEAIAGVSREQEVIRGSTIVVYARAATTRAAPLGQRRVLNGVIVCVGVWGPVK